MNIFVLDKDPAIAAQMLCDKHIVKMPLETAQLLSNVFSTALKAPNPFVSITNQNIEVIALSIKSGCDRIRVDDDKEVECQQHIVMI